MTIFLLSTAIVLLICYMLYLARRKDHQLLQTPPATKALPRTRYEQALKELSEFKKQPKPKSRHKQIEWNSEQYYLERRLLQIRDEVENEQKSYYLACKERELAWEDYRDYFKDLNFFEKFLSPTKLKELQILRKLYLDAERVVDLELSKFSAQSRVRYHEEKSIRDREHEISQKTRSSSAKSQNAESDEQMFSDQMQQDEIDGVDDQSYSELNDIETEPVVRKSGISSTAIDPEPEQHTVDSMADTPEENVADTVSDKTFCQANFLEKNPNFTGLSYIDESFSMVEIGLSVVREASFDHAFFISVLFNDRHQYQNCSFTGTDFSYSIWKRATEPHRILNTNFEGAKFSYARLEVIAFYNCRFSGVDFTGAEFQTVKFVRCSFEDCVLNEVDFSSTVMSSDMLNSIDFTKCLHPPKNFSTVATGTDSDNQNSTETSGEEIQDTVDGGTPQND